MLDSIIYGVPLFLALCFMWRGIYRSWFAFWGVLFSSIITIALFNTLLPTMDFLPSALHSSKYAIYLLVLPFLLWLIQTVLVLRFVPFKNMARPPKHLDRLVSLVINYGTFLLSSSWLVVALTLSPYRLMVFGEKLCGEAEEFTFSRRDIFLDTLVPVFFSEPVELNIMDLPKAIVPPKGNANDNKETDKTPPSEAPAAADADGAAR